MDGFDFLSALIMELCVLGGLIGISYLIFGRITSLTIILGVAFGALSLTGMLKATMR